MPRISYIAKEKNGFDDTETTVAQIALKVAEVGAILRGLVDEDNLLQYSDDTIPINIPPSNVTDMPLETRPVEHSMKFFGDFEQGSGSIIEKLWTPLNSKVDSNPTFASIGGIDDGAVQHAVTFENHTDAETGAVIKNDYKSKTIEVPTNYVPVTWEALYEYVAGTNSFCKVEWDAECFPTLDSSFDDLDDFIRQMNTDDENVLVNQVWFNKDTSVGVDDNEYVQVLIDGLFLSGASFNDSINSIEWSSSVTPRAIYETNGYFNLKIIRTNLFKVLP